MRVNGDDRVLLQLRVQLERLARARGLKRAGAARAPDAEPLGAVARTLAIARNRQMSERDLGRILVGALLAEEFGDRIAAEPRFAGLVDLICAHLDGDDEGATLLKAAVGDVLATEPHPPDETA